MISFADVERMLKSCAPGHGIQLKTHYRIIRYAELIYPSFPKHDEVEEGHVRKMARVLGILECARKFLKFK
jgi:hypothetical protein